jgi:hypothetical protein
MSFPNILPPRTILTFLLLFCLTHLPYTHAHAQNDNNAGDGGGATGVQPGSLGSGPSGSDDAAAAGTDTGSANLSRGAIVAIAVVCSLVVVLGCKSFHSVFPPFKANQLKSSN